MGLEISTGVIKRKQIQLLCSLKRKKDKICYTEVQLSDNDYFFFVLLYIIKLLKDVFGMTFLLV